jgi:arabinofuranosyltransferase
MPRITSHRLSLVLAVAACALLCTVAVRTAWVCDDAYISFRTADNAAHGYGLRWNVSERVQSFTNPLWVFALIPGRLVGFDLYGWSLALSFAILVGIAYVMARRVASDWPAGLLAIATLISSRAFVDFSTSGLENPLLHLLLLLFVWEFWREGEPRSGRLATYAGLALLTRLDSAVILAPALAVLALRSLRQKHWRLELWPLVAIVGAWEIFSVVYFGFPFPNTAYVKLGDTLPRPELIAQGFHYLRNSLFNDPVTLAAMLVAISLVWLPPLRRGWPLAGGILLHVAYVVWIGGDFMSGRFLSAPLLMAAALLARVPLPAGGCCAWAPAALMLALGFVAPSPNVTSGSAFNRKTLDRVDGLHIADERLYYWKVTGWLAADRKNPVPDHWLAAEGRLAKQNGIKVVTAAAIGFFGYEAGPSVHVIDHAGLADPLLARLPHDLPPQRIGHYNHRVPDGYVDVLEGRPDARLREPSLDAYYRALSLVVRGPLFSAARWRAIWDLNTGRLNDLIAQSSYGPQFVTVAQVAERRADGLAWDAPGNTILREGGVRVTLPEARQISAIEVSLDANDAYDVALRSRGVVTWRTTVPAVPNGNGLRLVLLSVKPDAMADDVEIRAGIGDRQAAFGHLRVR